MRTKPDRTSADIRGPQSRSSFYKYSLARLVDKHSTDNKTNEKYSTNQRTAKEGHTIQHTMRCLCKVKANLTGMLYLKKNNSNTTLGGWLKEIRNCIYNWKRVEAIYSAVDI